MKNKMFVLFIIILLLFTVVSCKESEVDVKTYDTTQETDDYFNSVLDDSNINDNMDENADDNNAADEEEKNEKEAESTKYGPTECGDNICQFYETNSNCSEDCDKLEDATLADYPEFLNDVKLVVGDYATSTDVITATVISTYLVANDIDVETILASELENFYNDDLILIGSPCINQATAELLHYDEDTCGDIVSEQNNAVIKLLVFDNNEIILITGYNEGDTRDASAMLTDESYNLNGAEEWVNLVSDGDINIYYSKN